MGRLSAVGERPDRSRARGRAAVPVKRRSLALWPGRFRQPKQPPGGPLPNFYYVDHPHDGRGIYQTVDALATALIQRGSGPLGVLTDAGERSLTEAELRRIGPAIRKARERATRTMEDENAEMAAALGLADSR
jgi:hypothetical protein